MEISMKKTALIMAGGKGERFWPRSRVTLPKQFLSLTDDGKTMIQLTVERIRPLVELEDVFLSDRMGGITEELQALLHSVDTVFALVTGSIAGHDLPNTVSGEINIFNGKGGDDLLLHGLDAIKLRAVLPRQQNFCSREMDLGRAL